MLWPNVLGQSGTAIAASYVVTSAPNDKSSAVTATSIHATTLGQLTVAGSVVVAWRDRAIGARQAWAWAAAAISAGWGASVCMRWSFSHPGTEYS